MGSEKKKKLGRNKKINRKKYSAKVHLKDQIDLVEDSNKTDERGHQ